MKPNIISRSFYIGLIGALLFLTLSTNAQDKNTKKILFIGNSYTYYWNLPQTVQAMAQSNDLGWIVRQSTAGGASWKDHWKGDKELETLRILESESWDIVIIQNHSMSTIESLEEFHEYGEKLIDKIKSIGATPILYSTWARNYNPLMQDKINDGYQSLAKKTGTSVVPVGLIWRYINELRPDLELYFPDGSHPALVGTYLNACIFFKYLSGMNTLSLDNGITMDDKDGEKLYLTIIPVGDAHFLQTAVDRFFMLN